MADKRMFSKSIIDKDSFLDLTLSTQALYFHLCMNADDEGFISNSKSIIRNTGAKKNDLLALIDKKFVFQFESGVLLIKDWKIHNSIKNDRFKQSTCIEREYIITNSNKEYVITIDKKGDLWNQIGSKMEPQWKQNGTEMDTSWNRNDSKNLPQNRLDKISIDKSRLEKEINKEKDAEPNVPSNHFLIDYLISNDYGDEASFKSLNTWISQSLIMRGEDKNKIDEICKSIINELTSMSKENITNIIGHVSMKISNGLKDKGEQQ